MISRRRLCLAGLVPLSLPLMGFVPPKPKPGTNPQACGADPELCSEQDRQKLLPHSDDPFWGRLKACQIDQNPETQAYRLVPTPEVEALNGTRVRVKGFTLPLDGSDKTSHFLIAVNTPVCFYHPPGKPNEILEVTASSPITWDEKLKTVEGVFAISAVGDAGVYFKLTQARLVAG
jgi:hypothetical protein